MSIRNGMFTIINQVRTLTNIVADSDSALDDDQIAEVLDRNRMTVQYLPLQEVRRIAPGGSVSYLDFEAPYTHWEGTASGRPFGYQLVDGGYNDITANGTAVNDPTRGWWTFGTAPTRPVMITGATYDIYGAAADILETRLVQLSEEFDFSTQGLDHKVSQKHGKIQSAIAQYRSQQRVNTSQGIRYDTC